MPLIQACFIFLAAFVSGVLNSVAGGGGLIMFPALLITGMPPVIANATSTVAVPGLIAGVKAYQSELQGIERLCVVSSSVSLVGGIIGALLTIWIPSNVLKQLVPYLLLLATLLFTFSNLLLNWLPVILPQAGHLSGSSLRKAALLHFFAAIYGGFYGLGISFILLALLRMLGLDHIHQINGLKVLLMSCVSIVATVTFIFAGVID